MMDSMTAETVTINMRERTVETDGEVLPVVWWGDDDNEPCPFEKAKKLSAGPDRDGLYVQVSMSLVHGVLQ